MRTKVLCCLAFVLALSLSACGGAASSAPASSAVATVSVSQSSTVNDQQEKTLYGVLNDIAMSTITVTTDEGQEVSFLHENVSMPENMIAGSPVVLTYIGTIENGNTDNAQLVKVELLGNVATGIVSEASMHFFLLTLEDGTQLEITLSDDSVVDLPNGLLDDEKVTVTYFVSAEDGEALVADTVVAAE